SSPSARCIVPVSTQYLPAPARARSAANSAGRYDDNDRSPYCGQRASTRPVVARQGEWIEIRLVAQLKILPVANLLHPAHSTLVEINNVRSGQQNGHTVCYLLHSQRHPYSIVAYAFPLT